MTPDDPRHGLYSGYVAGCRCPACGRANLHYDKQRDLRKLRGPLVVPPDRAAQHIERCLQHGMTYEPFVDAGISGASRIHRRLIANILATTEAKVLAVTPIPGETWFPKRGAVRRLRALVALGHMQNRIAAEVGVAEQHLSMLINEYRSGRIEPGLWKRIDNAYRTLAMTPGDSDAARRRAQRNQWPSPLAWDCIDTDPEPQGVRPDELTRRRVTRPDTDQKPCVRCGVVRQARGGSDMCGDCQSIERRAS